jgi:3-deoxy-D-manno-octulosonic-acid transferase
VPIILANGRVSSKTVNWSKLFNKTFNKISKNIGHFYMKSAYDADNLISLGVHKEKISIPGNLKFAGGSANIEPVEKFRSPLIVAGSARSREFNELAKAFKRVKEEFPNALFTIALRHMKSLTIAEMALESVGLSYSLRSREDSPGDSDVYIIDTMGELFRFYAVADVAFVGGTLARYGGHNPLEPAYFGVPVLFGPHIYANREAYEILLETGGGKTVMSGAELGENIIELLRDKQKHDAIGNAGKKAVEAMRAIPTKYEPVLEELLS